MAYCATAAITAILGGSSMLTDRHQTLLEARGLDAELLVRLGIESSDRLGRDTISIPYYDLDGRIVNHKYRTISGEKKFAQDEGGKCIFWNVSALLDETLGEQPVIITEGEFDAIAAMQAGYMRVISVPNGAPASAIGELTSTKYIYLDAAPAILRDAKEIILATDGDTAGFALRDDLASRLGRARCKWLGYPKEAKDLLDVVAKWGERGITETVLRAKWLAIDGVYRISELPPLNEPEAFKSGFPGLDQHYKLRIGDFCVVTGSPGKGKTTFTRNLACRMASEHRWRTLFASFEAVAQTDHKRALRTWYNGSRVIDQSDEKVAAADEWIDEFFRFVVPKEDDEVTIDWLIERISAAAVRDHCKLVIIDPWNEIDHQRPSDMTMTEYVGAMLRRMKRIARTLGIHLIIAAHPAKMQRNREGAYPRPALYDISDSAMWANRADVGVIVDRPSKDRDITVIDVVKVRFQDQIGEPGEITLRFNWQSGRYE
jgi:twinkle protein